MPDTIVKHARRHFQKLDDTETPDDPSSRPAPAPEREKTVRERCGELGPEPSGIDGDAKPAPNSQMH